MGNRRRRSTDDRPFCTQSRRRLLPLGGDVGFKGYALASMVEILSALLTGLGFGVEPTGRHNDGCFIAVFNVAAFRDLGPSNEKSRNLHTISWTLPQRKDSTASTTGEVEHIKRTERLRDGINIEDATWAKLKPKDKLGVIVSV